MKVVAFLPVKFNSRRVANKNMKPFSDGTPLMYFIQRTLLQVKEIDEIYCCCSDETVKSYLLDGVKWLRRDPRFDLDSASPNEMHEWFCSQIPADIYVISHATSPFTTPESISECISKVAGGEYDSAILAKEMREFLYQGHKPFNFSLAAVPRTQDLDPLYEEVNGAYTFSREVMEKYHARTGGRVYIHTVGKVEGIDIDYPEDFEIADAVYMKRLKEKKQ